MNAFSLSAHLKKLRLCFQQCLTNSSLGDAHQTLLNRSAVVGLANHLEIDSHNLL